MVGPIKKIREASALCLRLPSPGGCQDGDHRDAYDKDAPQDHWEADLPKDFFAVALVGDWVAFDFRFCLVHDRAIVA